ncbi:MAG: hypothetical protein U5L75_00585 [Candidatus Campbellbacteria bacterium]|nr:hypothetical protein [Candidatus Campbellbacteria bacterium]
MGNEKELLSNVLGVLVVITFACLVAFGVPYLIYETIPWLFWMLAGIYALSIISIPIMILDVRYEKKE